MKGWIKLHREILKSDTWVGATAKRKVIMISLVIMATHEHSEVEFNGEIIKLEPGEMITSYSKIAANSGADITIQNVRSCIHWLEKVGFLVKKSTQHPTQRSTEKSTHSPTQSALVITLVKYRRFQHFENNPTQHSTQHPTQHPTHKSTTFKNKEEIKEIKEEEDPLFLDQNFKQPLSQKLKAEMLKKKPLMFFDDSEDLPTLHRIGKKIKELVKIRKKEQGFTEFGATDDNAVVYFNALVDAMNEWELQNRFSPKDIESLLAKLVNRCKEKAETNHKSQNIHEIRKQFHNLINADNIEEKTKRIYE